MVLNFNGGAHVLRCLEHLTRTEWPAGDLELVVVDNASTDGSDREIEARFPAVRLVRSGHNLGFPANNLALRDLEGVDYVALVNNDAFVEPGWLAPLVACLETDRTIGAACPKLLFEPGFVDLTISVPTFTPGGGDTRDLGVRVSAVEVDGIDVWRRAQFHEGFFGIEHGHGVEEAFCWTGGTATLRVPVDPGKPASGKLRLRLAGPPGRPVRLELGDSTVVSVLGDDPEWAEVPLSGVPYDVVQNAGSVIVEGGYGADRGFLQPDGPAYDEPVDVFNWCGAGVLFPTRYLREVGLFDERFFMYYEDTDLAWRARARGWRHRYVPTSVFRHVHAATSVEGSALFTHFVERNRLLLLAKNAPWRLAAWAPVYFLLVTASYARRDVIRPMLRAHRPDTVLVQRRLRAFAGYLRLLPAMLADRLRLRRRQVVPDADLVAWMVPHGAPT